MRYLSNLSCESASSGLERAFCVYFAIAENIYTKKKTIHKQLLMLCLIKIKK